MVPGLPLPPEIQLAQRLAGNEQVTRDRALRKLRNYIVNRSQRPTGCFTPEEMLKIWKGLFYCLWMQDKLLQQEELGRTISQLVHAFQTTESQHLFMRAFWQTMIREWVGIDRLRLDKFYLLMRLVLRESLTTVKTRGWEERQIEQLLELLTTEVLNPDRQAPNGVKSHFLEIFLEELTTVGAAELTADQNLQFIDPFCQIAAHTKDSLVLHKITRCILEAIVEQAPLAIEDLMNELDTQSGEDEESDGGEESSEDEQDLQDTPPSADSAHRAGPEADKEQVLDDEENAGPVLQFDYEAIANRLFELASRQSTPSQNRKRLYRVIQKLRILAGGTFPDDDVPEKAYNKLLEGRRERKKKNRLSTLQPQNEKGGSETEASGTDLSPGMKRSRSKDEKTGQREPPRKRKKAGAKGAGAQQPARKRKQPLQSEK
ncbi:ribosomal RNA processing protein 1 homolog A [Arvicola amphibius]|uniref:ribosomal RNA processing protein 1 homolog A n=1 Tax=Arvicola amphibius TaxID=1047088 RepID=UPI0018E2B128|nr:ribosomal RNA processing protein 1 homolog A [Arvicola amphibius]